MMLDALSVASFYDAPRGAIVAGLIRDRLATLWPDVRGARIVALGYGRPYLGLWRDDASCCIDLTTSHPAPLRSEPTPPSQRCVVDGGQLPLDDLSVDRILLVHGLEVAHDARRTLRECWRVLRDDGRLLVVTPNRAGLWAHVESTPFGQGEPYTQGQVSRLLRTAMFAVDRDEAAVFIPPLDLKPFRSLAPVFERVGRSLMPRFAGVLLAEAVKDVYAAIPGFPVGRRIVVPSRLASVHARTASGLCPEPRQGQSPLEPLT
jgi:SAM-dependent methyltransferase